jgi:hypothetical protein
VGLEHVVPKVLQQIRVIGRDRRFALGGGVRFQSDLADPLVGGVVVESLFEHRRGPVEVLAHRLPGERERDDAVVVGGHDV